MTFDPEPHARWNGKLPLRGGLGIELARRGTLGAAVTFADTHYFTAARHVVGVADTSVVAVRVSRNGSAWEPSDGLVRLDAESEPGAAHLLAQADLTLLRTSAPLLNTTPSARRPRSGFGEAVAGSRVWLRGCRHRDWIETTYEGRFRRRHERLFERHFLDHRQLGVIDLEALGPASVQQGNSGTTVWQVDDDDCAVLGHLAAVSFVKRKGLIVLYRMAFVALGLDTANVVGEIAA